ncbi:hypothetical protein CEXT_693041 [Caerostris extrusa]|uniref:Uncharacterized protein n=1 Tax=Caerostris extrusa TaxID=172846 RepID=A0AAV4UA45_CAEEX|nr:hypothetical protein CEXT_693041 [Caerostris extrusa]
MSDVPTETPMTTTAKNRCANRRFLRHSHRTEEAATYSLDLHTVGGPIPSSLETFNCGVKSSNDANNFREMFDYLGACCHIPPSNRRKTISCSAPKFVCVDFPLVPRGTDQWESSSRLAGTGPARRNRAGC